jgi:hypothetical protein
MFKKLSIILLSAAFVMGCSDDEETITIDSSQPQGDFSVQLSGMFVEDNAPSSGTVEIGTDNTGTQFLHLGSNFETAVATGTVAVFLSTSDTYTADPGSGNPDLQLIGSVSVNGEAYFKIEPVAAAKFTHVILWCTSVGVQFGNAELN